MINSERQQDGQNSWATDGKGIRNTEVLKKLEISSGSDQWQYLSIPLSMQYKLPVVHRLFIPLHVFVVEIQRNNFSGFNGIKAEVWGKSPRGGSFLPDTCSASLYIGSNITAFQVTQRGVTQLLCARCPPQWGLTHVHAPSQWRPGRVSICHAGATNTSVRCHHAGPVPSRSNSLCRLFSYYSPGNLFIGVGPALMSSKVEVRLSNENSYWFVCFFIST